MIDWVEGAIVGVPAKSPFSVYGFYVNTYNGQGVQQYPAGQWHVVDLSAEVPPDTKAIHLCGLLLITHGTNTDTAQITVHYRTLGETYDYPYMGQCVEGSEGNRENHSCWVRLVDGKFEIKWTRIPSAGDNYPTESIFGVSLLIDAYMR